MPRRDPDRRLRLGVIKFASCDGCQLALLGIGPALLGLADVFRIVDFGEVSSDRADDPFDVLLVEGSISTPEQVIRIKELRERAGTLVTMGACATSGGIQALRGWIDGEGVAASVYPRPDEIATLTTATPIADHVKVDASLRGCPIDGGQLIEVLTSVALGRRPRLPDSSVCATCKVLGRVCVVVARGEPCLGPITRTGCGALCPAFDRGCYGCFGPRSDANITSFEAHLRGLGLDDPGIARRLSGFTNWAPEYRSTITALGGPPGFRSATVSEPSAEAGH